MAQKINPTSFRIGKQFPWIFVYQPYGKFLTKFSFHHSLFGFFLFLNKLYFSKKFSASSSINVLPKSFFVVTNFLDLKLLKPSVLENKESQILLYPKNWYPKNSKFKLFISNNYFYSAQILTFYFRSLLSYNSNFRKSSLILVKLLSQQINKNKLIYSKFGIKKIKFKGFKIKISGRFENSKTQMSKKLEQTIGSLSLLSVNSYIEFFDLNICSKLGVCSFKIWLFYQ